MSDESPTPITDVLVFKVLSKLKDDPSFNISYSTSCRNCTFALSGGSSCWLVKKYTYFNCYADIGNSIYHSKFTIDEALAHIDSIIDMTKAHE